MNTGQHIPLTPLKPHKGLPTDGPPWIDNAYCRQGYDVMWIVTACLMMAYSLVFWGYRAGALIITAVFCTMAASFLTSKIRSRFSKLSYDKTLTYSFWNGALFAMVLPLVRDFGPFIVGGLTLGVLMNFFGRSHRLRIHPIALTLVLIWLVPTLTSGGDLLTSRGMIGEPISTILTPNHLLVGDAFEVREGVSASEPDTRPWMQTIDYQEDAVVRYSPQVEMLLHQRELLDDVESFSNLLVSNTILPLDELLVGVVPGSLGAGSPVLLLGLGLLLIHRRHASWRMAVAALVSMLTVYLFMPMRTGGQWTVVISQLSQLNWQQAVTFMSYFFFASPWLMIVLILGPSVDPMSRSGRVVFGLLLGGLVACGVWFFQSPEAIYGSLVIAGLVSRKLDGMHRSSFVDA
ncbi:Na(+)-translocating NADH-quinone reductase subunit B [Poriferisphaera corsica]|uniref:Na(+)-translocating NADH-quinone reductase subunit B n=1 Tax=Poriferisphaera corsica TaxID=2528020 RepID=A0A517YQ90_9BACT|nr:RnfABCDGE type electron transport complex subunit D [Poriferisphaera corsica]QDU32393.1 Na(+)-translocating NADH-quinone reductase subunit B [Poriferisphaera corsica]